MSRLGYVLVLLIVTASVTFLNQAAASPTASPASASLARQLASLQKRVGHDEATIRTQGRAIRALQGRHITVDVATATGAGNGAGAIFGQALCPGNDQLVGGGAGWSPGSGNSGDILNASQPVDVGGSPGGWIASGTPASSEFAPFTVTAFCVH